MVCCLKSFVFILMKSSTDWQRQMTSRRIPFTDDLNLINMLTDTATITEWNLQV